jgi:ArsR family transcriptional regulator, arsenate/arsenite/antimonite-responsive transcriptional repressor
VPPRDGIEDVERTGFHDRLPGIDDRLYDRAGVIDACQYPTVKTIATLACPPLLAGPIGRDEADRVATALKVLAEPARLRLLSLIQAQPGGEACVCHLTEPLGLTQPTVSHHLKVLLDAGLVERDQRGSWAFFRVRPEPLAALREVLA